MIRLEDLKQAIDAIAARDTEIGFSLDALLGAGRLAVPGSDNAGEEDVYFLFDGEQVPVRRISFLQNKSAVLEQRLVLKFGELVEKEALQQARSPLSFPQQVRLIQRAGLDALVLHELEYAACRAARKAESAEKKNDIPLRDACLSLQAELEALLKTREEDRFDPHKAEDFCFVGQVNIDMPAYFLPFTCHWDFLRQIAVLNLEFFHLRFVLDRLLDFQAGTIFMAVVKSRIAGMMAVDIKPRLFYRGLEIFHIATVGGQAEFDFDWSLPALHGVGTFLVAGLWLLWKQGRLPADEIVLTSELEARGFYAALGFQMRPPFLYVLKRPSASLLSSIVALLRSSLRLEQKTLRELSRLIQTEIGRLASRTWLACADKVIIEINRHHSNRLRELADIFHIPPPPRRSPINVHTPLTKIGWPYAQVNSDKVMGILESDEPDQVRAFSGEDDLSRKIAGHVIRFLLSEKQAGRIPKEFFPLQAGVGWAILPMPCWPGWAATRTFRRFTCIPRCFRMRCWNCLPRENFWEPVPRP